MLRVLLMAEGSPGRVVRLAEEIERRVPGAMICGIVHQVPTPSRPGMAARMKRGLRACGSAIGRFALDFIHGSRVRQTGGSARDLPLSKCNERGWAFCPVEEMKSQQVLEFARQQDADLGVAFGLASVPEALVALPKQGSIQGQIFSLDRQGSEIALADKATNAITGTRVRVQRIAHDREDMLLASFALHPQPLDTAVSLELKSNLILQDLLIQGVAAVAQHSDSEAAGQIGAWIRNTFPSYLTQSEGLMVTGSPNQVPPLRIRPRWKLCVYSLFLLSPFVLFRNWLCRWRKRYPVLFLNHHLISDRYHPMALPTEAFLRQVRFLQRHYRVVSLCEASKLLKSGSVREPTVVLTFDDGYEDNFLNLRGVAEETRVPVVLFISTQIVTEHKEFTHDLERGLTGFRALRWDQIRYWSADNAEFESHTCSHYDCGSTDPTALEKEIVESKRELESRLGKRVTAFAFPVGKPENMSALARTIAGKTYDHFLSSFGGENVPHDSEIRKHLLRKHLQGNAWENEFELQNVFEIAASLKRLVRLAPKSSDKMRLPAGDRSDGQEPQAAGD